jgi:predicted transcriptional regulator
LTKLEIVNSIESRKVELYDNYILTAPKEERVTTKATINEIIARASVDDVIARTTKAPQITKYSIIPLIGVDRIVTKATKNSIALGTAINKVVAITALEIVDPLATENRVIAT